MAMWGLMLTTQWMENTTATTTTQCVTEGNMTNGTVAPEYQTQCCAGLASKYSYATDPNEPAPTGGGSVCYQASKGTPVCKNNNTTNEWRYYPDGTLLLKMDCQTSALDSMWSTPISDDTVNNEDVVMCTMDYRPVCGIKDGKTETYGNACGLGAAKAQYLHEWECNARSSVTLSNKTLASIGNAVLAVFKNVRQSDGRLTATGRERAQVIADRLAKLLEQHQQTMMVSRYTPSGYQLALTKWDIIQALYQEISVLVAPKSSCSAYTDGCNTCISGTDGADACTMMACKLPAEKIPHCLNN